jgi:hypothetical protein
MPVDSVTGFMLVPQALKIPFILALVAASALLAPGVAAADQGTAVVRDCLNHGSIQGHYSQQAYSQALAELPTDVSEYSDCANLIRQAQLAAASHHGSQGGGTGGFGAAGGTGGGGAGGSSLASATAAERRSLGVAPRRGASGVDLGGGEVIRPTVARADIGSAVSRLPAPLLAVLIALVACALLGGGSAIHDRVRARGSH